MFSNFIQNSNKNNNDNTKKKKRKEIEVKSELNSKNHTNNYLQINHIMNIINVKKNICYNKKKKI